MECLERDANFITWMRAMRFENGITRLVLGTAGNARYSKLYIGDQMFPEKHNYVEPYDVRAHVFNLPSELLEAPVDFRIDFENCGKRAKHGDPETVKGHYDPSCIEQYEPLLQAMDHKIAVKEQTETQLADGVVSRIYLCEDKLGKPVRMFTLFVDPKKTSLLMGSPDNAFKAGYCAQTVQGHIEAAVRDGYRVIAAANADFFDMFGDCMPSGLAVKEGQVLANADTDRPFFGTTKDGMPIIDDLVRNPEVLSNLQTAVGGRDVMLRGGVEQPDQLALLEPFGETRHPRTCVGILPDGTYVILIVIGRIPEYSNGATLVDLMRVMQSFGAVDAINLDGGGSSTLHIRKEDGSYELLNRTADLERPLDNLLRDIYNSMLIIEK